MTVRTLNSQPNKQVALQAAISAIRRKDADAALDLCSGTGGLQSEQEQLYTRNIDKMIKGFADKVAKDDAEELHIDIQYCVGNRKLFVWGWDNPPKSPEPYRVWMIFEHNSANELLWIPQLSRLDDFSMLLVNMARQRAKSDEGSKAVKKQGFAYEIAIPGTTEGDTAYLQFNGTVYDCNIFEDTVRADDKVLSFYQQACYVLRDKPMEEFAQFYTRKSRENFMEQLADVKGRDHLKRWYRDDLIESGIKVLFIMDAKPFYFIFYRKSRSSNKVIRFTDVVLDPTDNKLKLTNFNYNDYLHDFLEDRELFINPILKSLIKKESK